MSLHLERAKDETEKVARMGEELWRTCPVPP